jgi:hypothetical protein
VYVYRGVDHPIELRRFRGKTGNPRFDWAWFLVRDEDGLFFRFVVPASHPYVVNFKARVVRLEAGWLVKWFTFDGQRHEDLFDSEGAARRYAGLLRVGPHFHDNRDGLLEFHDRTWRHIYPARAGGERCRAA